MGKYPRMRAQRQASEATCIVCGDVFMTRNPATAKYCCKAHKDWHYRAQQIEAEEGCLPDWPG